MKAVLFCTLLLGAALGRKFDDEVKNEALKNTRRVQQFYGSSQQIYWNFGAHYWRLDMTPPAVRVGWEFVQSESLVNKGNTFPASSISPTTVTQMLAYKMRFRLVAHVQVYLKAQFYINNLIYNSLVFDLNKFLAFAFADLAFVYSDQVASAANPKLPV